MLQRTIEREKAARKENERTKPEGICARLQRRPIEDEISIALSQERSNLFVALSGPHLFANLTPQVERQARPRIGECFVLADETTHLLREQVDTSVKFCFRSLRFRPGAHP